MNNTLQTLPPLSEKTQDEPNTFFGYLYRDSEDFKTEGYVVFEGRITLSQKELLENKLHEGIYFNPEQVDITSIRESYDEEEEDFHEITEIRTTNLAPTEKQTIEEFVASFTSAIWHT